MNIYPWQLPRASPFRQGVDMVDTSIYTCILIAYSESGPYNVSQSELKLVLEYEWGGGNRKND